MLVRVQPPPPADHPRSRSAIPRLRSDPARIELHATPRRALPVLSRVRGGYLPGGCEILAAGRGGDAEVRPPYGPDGEVHRAHPHDDAAGCRFPESVRAAEAPRVEQAGQDADGGRTVHVRPAHADEP